MTKATLRKEIDTMLDQVDEQLLHIVHQILEREVQAAEFEMSDEDMRIFEQRKAELHSGKDKGVTHEELIARLKNSIAKHKK